MRALLAASLAILLLGGCGLTTTADHQLLANGRPVMGRDPTPYESGKQYLLAGNYGLAAGLLRAALRADPGSTDVLNALAVTYEGLGRHDIAQRYFAQALAADPRSVQTLNNIARSLITTGSAAAAAPYLQRAAALDPGNPVIRANLDAVAQASQPRSDSRQASLPTETAPTALWIERTTATRQTLVTRSGIALSGSAEQNALLPFVSFSDITAGAFSHAHVEKVSAARGPMPAPSSVPVAPRAAVVIANGNGRNGMAARMGDYLEKQCWMVGGLRNADRFTYETTSIGYKAGFRDAAVALAALLPVKVEVVENNDESSDVILRIGRDLLPFDHVINAAFKAGGNHHGAYFDLQGDRGAVALGPSGGLCALQSTDAGQPRAERGDRTDA